MKRILPLMLAFWLSANAFAQSTQKINYQAVIRNAAGDPIANQKIVIRLSLQKGSNGKPQYVEDHMITTNNLGLVNLQIGGGKSTLGSYSNIDWGSGDKYLNVEADLNGSSNFVSVATTELMSVPYAISASTSQDNQWMVKGDNVMNKNTGSIGIGGVADPSAKLDISASDKGILIPRIEKANRPNPATDGLLIYQIDDTPGFYFYDGKAWKRLNDEAPVATPAAPAAIIPFTYANSSSIALKNGTIDYFLVPSSGSGFQTYATEILLDDQGSFLMPRNGTIDNLILNLRFSSPFYNVQSLSFEAKLYKREAAAGTYDEVPGTTLTYGPFTTADFVNGKLKATKNLAGLALSVANGDSFKLAISVTAAGVTSSGFGGGAYINPQFSGVMGIK